MPKSERNPKLEIRNAAAPFDAEALSGIRVFFGFQVSGFGFFNT
jgi:hypothetical protein